MEALWILLGIVLTIAAIMYIGVPILLKFNQKMLAHPRLVAVAPERIPPSLGDFLRQKTEEVERLGFTNHGHFSMPDAVPNVHTYLTMLQNVQTGDKAMVTVMLQTIQGVQKIGTSYVEFTTRFSDERVFNTLNSNTVNSFVKPTTVKTNQLPGVQDVRLLYDLHRYTMHRDGAGGNKMLYQPGEEIAYLYRVIAESYEYQAKNGLMAKNTVTDIYELTFSGAFRYGWAQLPPMSGLFKAGLKQKENALLAEYHKNIAR